MSKVFQKGHKLGMQPALKGFPEAKLATFREPFTTEQAQYVSQLLEFQNIDHWFPYTACELHASFCDHESKAEAAVPPVVALAAQEADDFKAP